MKYNINPKDYENAFFEKLLYEFPPTQFRVEKDDKVKGIYSNIYRQVDNAIYHKGKNKPFLVADTKRYSSRKLSVDKVDCFIGFLNDINIDFGILISPLGFSNTAKNRAKEKEITVCVLSFEEALEIQWRSIARDIFPYDWTFHPKIANALYRFDRGENPENIINAIENIPYEEWESLVNYAVDNYIEEATNFLWFIAMNHYDSGWRFNAVKHLIETGMINQFDTKELFNKEKDSEIRLLLKRIK